MGDLDQTLLDHALEQLKEFAWKQSADPEADGLVTFDHNGTAILNPFCDEGMRPLADLNAIGDYYGWEKLFDWAYRVGQRTVENEANHE